MMRRRSLPVHRGFRVLQRYTCGDAMTPVEPWIVDLVPCPKSIARSRRRPNPDERDSGGRQIERLRDQRGEPGWLARVARSYAS
jgi:hypothetical protein